MVIGTSLEARVRYAEYKNGTRRVPERFIGIANCDMMAIEVWKLVVCEDLYTAIVLSFGVDYLIFVKGNSLAKRCYCLIGLSVEFYLIGIALGDIVDASIDWIHRYPQRSSISIGFEDILWSRGWPILPGSPVGQPLIPLQFSKEIDSDQRLSKIEDWSLVTSVKRTKAVVMLLSWRPFSELEFRSTETLLMLLFAFFSSYLSLRESAAGICNLFMADLSE